MADMNNAKKINKNLLLAILAKYFNFITAAIVLAILAFGYFYFIGPSYGDAREEIDTLAEARKTEYNQLMDYSAKIRNYLDDYNQIKKNNIAKVDEMIPGGGDSEDLYTLLEMIVLKNGSVPASISIDNPDTDSTGIARRIPGPRTGGADLPPELGKITVGLKVNEVDYNGLKKLLSSIENNLRIMDISSIDFSPGNESVDLKIITYYYRGSD